MDTVHKKNCEEESSTTNIDTEVEVNSIDQEVTPSDDEYAQILAAHAILSFLANLRFVVT